MHRFQTFDDRLCFLHLFHIFPQSFFLHFRQCFIFLQCQFLFLSSQRNLQFFHIRKTQFHLLFQLLMFRNRMLHRFHQAITVTFLLFLKRFRISDDILWKSITRCNFKRIGRTADPFLIHISRAHLFQIKNNAGKQNILVHSSVFFQCRIMRRSGTHDAFFAQCFQYGDGESFPFFRIRTAS